VNPHGTGIVEASPSGLTPAATWSKKTSALDGHTPTAGAARPAHEEPLQSASGSPDWGEARSPCCRRRSRVWTGRSSWTPRAPPWPVAAGDRACPRRARAALGVV